MFNIGNGVESKTYLLGKSITRNSLLTEVFDGYEIWSGKCDISAVFSVTPNVRILYHHPTWVLRHPVSLMDSSVNCFYSVIYSII
jgi:hypothetical protein